MAKKSEKETPTTKFKFKSLKVYCSSEWMIGATKKYRQVFDRSEIDYMRAEFSFYNKLFDEAEWEAEVQVKSFETTEGKRREICDQKETMKIKTEDNVVTVHKGWGVETKGNFWRKGDYCWEAYIDGQLVGSANFFIEDIGLVTPDINPYFDVKSLKVYNGPYDGWNIKDRKYLKRFNRKEARFVWSEITLQNKTGYGYNIELFHNFYDRAGQFKGQAVTLDFVKSGQKGQTVVFQEGWGNKDGGAWPNDKYMVEVVFMDQLVAAIPFEVSDSDELEGVHDFMVSAELKPYAQVAQNLTVAPEKEETVEDVMKNLDELIGLQNIKTKIREHIQYLNFLKLRKEKGFADSEKISLHSVFTGNPGTGKTTVVKLLGKIYQKMGLLTLGHVHEVDRADLVGEFIGQTAPKVRKAIDEARGGILFIDEAYSLYRSEDDSKDFGREVIETLIKEMSDGQGNIAIMVAGYPHEMEMFVNSNPGLKSRFNYYFHFEDYSPDELMLIARYACEKRAVNMAVDAADHIYKIIVDTYRNRDKSFGNARFVHSIIDESKMFMGLRLMANPNIAEMTNEDLATITIDDVKKLNISAGHKRIDIPIDEALLRETMAEFCTLTGLDTIKNEITELIKLVRYYRESGKDVLNKFSLHSVFKGNPGTGKTTVARLIGKIYKALGLLERGHVVEVDREGLIAGYIGQTAIKTKARLEEARNGVLFIDEAYSLAEGGQHSFGDEAIEVILKYMEDNRGHIAIIVAGYSGNMEEFLKANPGLRSRFDRVFDFEDFTASQLYDVALNMFTKESLTPNAEAEKHLRDYFEILVKNRDKYFGNARSVRQVVEKSIKNQNLRMAFLPKDKRTEKDMETISLDDVKDFVYDESKAKGIAKVGFKY